MNFLALLPIFSTLIERLFPDKEKADAAKLALQQELDKVQAEQAQAEAAKAESQSKVIVAETQSQSWAARNWRPHLMYCLMLTYPINYLVFPLLKALHLDITSVPVPDMYWNVLIVGLGGYIGVDGIKSYAKAKFDNDKYMETIRKRLFPKGMTQAQVDALESAAEEAQK